MSFGMFSTIVFLNKKIVNGENEFICTLKTPNNKGKKVCEFVRLI